MILSWHCITGIPRVLSLYRRSDDISSLDAISHCPTSTAYRDPCSSSVPYRPAHVRKVLTLSFLMPCRTSTEIGHSSGGEPRKVQHAVPETLSQRSLWTRFFFKFYDLHGEYKLLNLTEYLWKSKKDMHILYRHSIPPGKGYMVVGTAVPVW